MPLRQRLEVLSDLLYGKIHWGIREVPTARLRWEKEAMLEILRGERRKGIVFKQLGGSNLAARKLTFRPSAIFRVLGYASGRRIRVERLEVGCPNIPDPLKVPTSHHLPPIGSAVEISWLGINSEGVPTGLGFVRKRENAQERVR